MQLSAKVVSSVPSAGGKTDDQRARQAPCACERVLVFPRALEGAFLQAVIISTVNGAELDNFDNTLQFTFATSRDFSISFLIRKKVFFKTMNKKPAYVPLCFFLQKSRKNEIYAVFLNILIFFLCIISLWGLLFKKNQYLTSQSFAFYSYKCRVFVFVFVSETGN